MTWSWVRIRKLLALHSSFLKAGSLRWTGEFTKARGSHKNEWCLNKVNSLFDLHMPEVVVLQNMSDRGAHRAPRIQELNERIAELADRRGLVVQKYSRARVLDYFSEIGVATTKQKLAEAIAKQVPALRLFLPRERKPARIREWEFSTPLPWRGCTFTRAKGSGRLHNPNSKIVGHRSGHLDAPCPSKGACHAARCEARGREAIHSSISSSNHATPQAPSLTREGNWPAASRRAICANE